MTDFIRKQPQTHSRAVAVYSHILVNVAPLTEAFYPEDLIKEIIGAAEKKTKLQIDLNTNSVVHTLGEEIERIANGLARVIVTGNTFMVIHNVDHGGPGGRYVGKGEKLPGGGWSIKIRSNGSLIRELNDRVSGKNIDAMLPSYRQYDVKD